LKPADVLPCARRRRQIGIPAQARQVTRGVNDHVGAKAVGLAQDLIDLIPVVRKERELEIKKVQEKKACEIDVQFKITDWRGKSFEYAMGYVEFEDPGLPMSANGLSFDKITLSPGGMVSLTVDPGAAESITGTAKYSFKPGEKLIQFEAVQHFKPHKTKAKTLSDATSKFGLKGSVGVEFKVVSVGGEMTKESEYKQGYEDEVEWEIEAGVPTFLKFSQI
jgi:hypothetical protein